MALTPFFGRGISAWEPWENNLFDPWLPIPRVWDAMDFSVPTAASSFSRDAMAVANTRVDWKETPEAHVFTADLPGLRKEDLKIDLVEKNTLRISAGFMRQFRLPENVNLDGISAKLENGVLTVNAPKTQPDAANGGDVKSIDIGSA
ncbi:hypothetical protein SUGI_0538650 [Cryptomeria japonica]|nr:hypothetical protein SUGI_0538650 [Cryptomeria japonica]